MGSFAPGTQSGLGGGAGLLERVTGEGGWDGSGEWIALPSGSCALEFQERARNQGIRQF